MTKALRIEVYNKYNGHCAYCGKVIEYKDMQVDHIVPKYLAEYGANVDKAENYNPTCRRCNHYKRAHSLDVFRELMITLHKRIQNIYICKVAEDYGLIEVKPWDGKFYYERVDENGNINNRLSSGNELMP